MLQSTGLFAIFALDQNNNGTMSYVIKDHQGSLNATVTGGAVSHYGFDAWGRRRNPQTLSYDNVSTSIDRGYTMHEHYDNLGLINMNGRLYDPLIGRMLSPDIVIQDEQNSQAYNRYSYCLNNPLRFTDPSGYVTTIPPEFEIYYYPELIGSYDAHIDKLTEAGAKNINIHNTDESEGKTTTTISWSVRDNSFQMTIVDQHLKDYEQFCQNSCVATTLVAQEMRYSYGNPDITEKWIMSTDKESYNNGLFVDKALYKYLEKTSVYKKASYSTKDDFLDYEKHAYREIYDDNGVFFNFIGEHGHVVNASVGIEFLLNGQVLNHEIRIWDAGKENGCTAGFRSLNFYNHPDKISHKM